jgi:hypothetical protein
MIWFSTLTRLALFGVAGWFGYQTLCEHQTRRKLERELAHVEQELARISPPPSSDVIVQIANPSNDFCSWLCYIPEGKHVKIVCAKGGEPHETVMDFGVSSVFRKIYLQLSINTTQDTSAKPIHRLTLWGPNADEKLLPMGRDFELLKHEFLVESEEDRRKLAAEPDSLKSRTRVGVTRNLKKAALKTSLRENLRSVTCNPESDVVLLRYTIERIVEEKLESHDFSLTVIAEDSD